MRPETMTGGDILDNDRLHEILLVWMDCRERGEPVEVGSLMLPDERPELVAEIRRWVACVEEFEARFGLAEGMAETAETGLGHPKLWASCTTRFGDLREHASGGLGVVFEAHDEEIGRSVALKFIKRIRPGQEDVRRFLAEARLTGCLEHPGIVPIYGIGQGEDGQPCYAMRLIRGESLDWAIRGFHEPNAKGLAPASRAEVWRRPAGADHGWNNKHSGPGDRPSCFPRTDWPSSLSLRGRRIRA